MAVIRAAPLGVGTEGDPAVNYPSLATTSWWARFVGVADCHQLFG